MTDAPLRIWATVNGVRRRDPSGAVSLIGGWESEDWGRGGHEYRLHTREALAQSPIVQAMIAEAVERSLGVTTLFAEELAQWAVDELERWPSGTPYADDLAMFAAAIRRRG